MKVFAKLAVYSAVAIGVSSVAAGQVELDTDDAHIIVVRPVDAWSGDAELAEYTMKNLKDRVAAFTLYTGPKTSVSGFTTLFQSVEDAPQIKAIQEALSARDTKIGSINKSMHFIIKPVIAVQTEDLPKFFEVEKRFYRNVVINQGNPDTLQTRVKRKKVLGSIASVASLVAMSSAFGLSNGTAIASGLNLPDDVYSAFARLRGTLVPVDVEPSDLSTYKRVEVRRVTAEDRVGQIIIAYKSDKTEAAELAALVKAVPTLLGADTTPEMAQKARDEDFAKRQAIWKECVLAKQPECPPED
jgi:hypothetical protein